MEVRREESEYDRVVAEGRTRDNIGVGVIEYKMRR